MSLVEKIEQQHEMLKKIKAALETSHYVIFGPRMRKSYKVTLSESIRYKNDRPPHVESDWDIKEGTRLYLHDRKVTTIRGGRVAVMYDVDQVGHITVFVGHPDEAHCY